MARRTLPILLALFACLAWAGPASAANLFDRLAADLLDNGSLDACKYNQNDLKKIRNAIPEDAIQYNAPFVAALDDAIAARAQGACNKKKQAPAQSGAQATPGSGAAAPPASSGGSGGQPAQKAAPSTPGVAQAPPTPQADPTPVSAIATDNAIALASRSTNAATDPPVPMLLLAILAGLLALSAVTFGVARWLAWEPAWSVRARHAAGEAGWRASSTFSEFADFVRLGR